MRHSPSCTALVSEYEGEKLAAYLCPAGKWTIGFGHTGPDVYPGQRITHAQSLELLSADLEKFSAGVTALLGGYETLQCEFDAMVSLAFNIGLGLGTPPRAFRTSSVLRLHLSGHHAEAADAFRMWNKATVDGKLVVLPGLVRRREAERALYLKGI